MNDKSTTKRKLGVRSCNIGSTMAGIGLVLVGAGLLGARLAILTPINAFLTFGMGMFLILLATVLLAIGLAISFERGSPIAVRSWSALAACIAVIAIGGVNFPSREGAIIHDVSTDVINPPQFVALIKIRADDNAKNPPEYAGEETARIQQETYPDLVTRQFQATPEEVFTAASEVARELDWEIAAEIQAEGRLEATDITTWFRFRDDIVVRIQPRDGGSTLDVRSKSRVGRGDMGTNAKRIREFLARLESRVS